MNANEARILKEALLRFLEDAEGEDSVLTARKMPKNGIQVTKTTFPIHGIVPNGSEVVFFANDDTDPLSGFVETCEEIAEKLEILHERGKIQDRRPRIGFFYCEQCGQDLRDCGCVPILPI